MTQVFDAYNKGEYLKWHDENVDNGVDFEKSVTELRDALKADSAAKLEELGQLLSQIRRIAEPECRVQSKGLLSGEFELPIRDFSREAFPARFELLFKSVDSIIEKCWRKNATRKENFIGLANLRDEVKDLIRTSVVCPTLTHARIFSERFEAWKDYISAEEVAQHFPTVIAIEVDREAKPASGYFAYHSLVHFNDGISVEVQFYSILSAAWRNMSHKLYEKTRIGESALLSPGAPASRLISLGHLLHLAEYELERLVDELKRTL